ncbi:hypothetical protein [Nocardiopsis synnemataformans]|uniref:hypothetical protein n=1 Tax=Nocardiopsis synnemataformans TaxID=61305 RepID=UPI003EC0A4E0
MTHEHVVAGIAAALRAGVLTAGAVALEARNAADSGPSLVTSLTRRRLMQTPPATRPLPSVAAYVQPLPSRTGGDGAVNKGEMR